jgi:hypothetical protein
MPQEEQMKFWRQFWNYAVTPTSASFTLISILGFGILLFVPGPSERAYASRPFQIGDIAYTHDVVIAMSPFESAIDDNGIPSYRRVGEQCSLPGDSLLKIEAWVDDEAVVRGGSSHEETGILNACHTDWLVRVKRSVLQKYPRHYHVTL